MTSAFRTAKRGYDKFMIRLLPGMRESLKAQARQHGRSMNSEVLFLISEGMKAKGPAARAIAPDHGSTNSEKETDMNNMEHSIAASATPAAKSRPSNDAIVREISNLDGEIIDLRLASMVLDEYLTSEFQQGRGCEGPFPVCLTEGQVSGIEYMANHVRELACKLEIAFDKAFGREVTR